MGRLVAWLVIAVTLPGLAWLALQAPGEGPAAPTVTTSPLPTTRLSVKTVHAGGVHALETRLAAHGGFNLPRLSSAWDIDSQGVIRSAEGAVLGQWGIDQPHLHQQVHR